MEEIILFFSMLTLLFVLLVLYNSKSHRINSIHKSEDNNNYYRNHNKVPSSYIKQRFSDFYVNSDQLRHNHFDHHHHQQHQDKEDKRNEVKKEERESRFSYIANNTIEKSNPLPYYIDNKIDHYAKENDSFKENMDVNNDYSYMNSTNNYQYKPLLRNSPYKDNYSKRHSNPISSRYQII